jgi:hypothetical protein
MTRLLRSDADPGSPAGSPLGDIRVHMARAMIGRTVELLADTHRITHGIVTAVFTEAGMPKLLVDGTRYDMNQVLTVVPTFSI